MKKKLAPTTWMSSIAAVLLIVLRSIEVRKSFDPATGLTLHTIWNILPPVVLALAATVEFILARGVSKEKVPFREAFSVPDKGETMVFVMGSLLLAAGGILSLLQFVAVEGGLSGAVTGVLAVVTAGCILMLVRSFRREDRELSVGLILPAMFFGVFLTLTAYLPAGTDPVLSRYWLKVLASALIACAFSTLAGFFMMNSRPRTFVFVSDLAFIAAVGAIAALPLHMVMMIGGSAMILGQMGNLCSRKS